MAEPYRAPKGTEIHSDPIKKRLYAAEPGGDVVYLGFDFTNIRENGSIPAIERQRFTAGEISEQRRRDEAAIEQAISDARKLKILQQPN